MTMPDSPVREPADEGSLRAAPDYTAKPGTIWVCGACGKTSRDRYWGDELSPSWDESCFLNAMLCDEASLVRQGGVGRVVKANPVEGWKDD